MADVYIKKQKLIKIGNSVGLIFDKKFLDQSGIKFGDSLVVRVDEDQKSASIEFPKKKNTKSIKNTATKNTGLQSKISPELQEWTAEFLRKNAQALKTLANL